MTSALHEFTSHVSGKNATVRVFPDRVEWETAGSVRKGLAVVTLGASALASGLRRGAGSEVIPVKAITSVTTRKGLRNTTLSLLAAVLQAVVGHSEFHEVAIGPHCKLVKDALGAIERTLDAIERQARTVVVADTACPLARFGVRLVPFEHRRLGGGHGGAPSAAVGCVPRALVIVAAGNTIEANVGHGEAGAIKATLLRLMG